MVPCFVLAAIAIGYSNSLAVSRPDSYVNFDVFFAALIALNGYIAWNIRHEIASSASRMVWLLAIGTASYLPHYIHAPTHPYQGDEFAHFLQANNMFTHGRVFTGNPLVPQAANYPGFEGLTVAMRQLTGLSSYQAGTVVLLICHIITVVAIYWIASYIAEPRVGLIAAFAYSLSPQMLFFDSLLSYESLAMPLAFSAIALAIATQRETDRKKRAVLASLLAVVSIACIMTHHLSSFLMVTGVLALSILRLLSRFGRQYRSGAFLTLCIGTVSLALAIAWSLVRHANLFTYLTVNLSVGAKALTSRLFGTVGEDSQTALASAHAAASRKPLSGTRQPLYETIAAQLTPFILLALFAYGLWLFRRRISVEWIVAVGIALGYFILLPLLFSAGAQEAVHRSWAFTFAGIAITTAVPISHIIDRAEKNASSGNSTSRTARSGSIVAALVALLVVGGYGQGVSYITLFPGPFLYQSDGRNVPQELFAVAGWIKDQNIPTDRPILADRKTGTVITSYTGVAANGRLAAGFFLGSSDTRATLAAVKRDVSLIVIDKRMSYSVSNTGAIFWRFEPVVVQPLGPSILANLRETSWLNVVHETPNYVVFKVMR